MNLRQILAVLAFRRVLVCAVFGLMSSTVLLAGLLQAPRYRAQAELLVDLRADPVSTPGGVPLSAPAQLATQVDIARSDRVLALTLSRLEASQRDLLQQAWAADASDGVQALQLLAESLRERLDVRPARDSSVITLAVDAPQPALAAALANGLAQATQEVALQLRVEPARRFNDFFEDRAAAAAARLSAAQSTLRRFQAEQGLVVSDERLDVENNRMAELSTQMTALQALTADSASRQAQAQEGRADRLQEVLNHPLISQLKADIGRAETQVQQLALRLGERHPQLLEARKQLDDLRQRLVDETRRVSGGAGVAERIHRQREAELRTSLNAQRARLLALKGKRDEALVLQREVDQAQRAHDALQQRLQQSSLESRNTQGSLAVLSPARPPLHPSTPPWWLHALLGALLGLLSAVGLALALELRQRRVHTVDDLQAVLGPQMVVELPARDSPLTPPPRLLRPQIPVEPAGA